MRGRAINVGFFFSPEVHNTHTYTQTYIMLYKSIAVDRIAQLESN